MSNTSGSVSFFYGNAFGRCLLKTVMCLHLDRIGVWFLRSPMSRPMMRRYVKKNGIAVTPEEMAQFRSYREMFIRTRTPVAHDTEKTHLISPCDGWLSVFPIDEHCCFSIKGSHYSISDFLQDSELAKKYDNGMCLIFRLCASDYHHYCYIDDGYQGENHFIPGQLHSVQPIACEKYPVYVKNRRSWCLLETDNFGPVVQCEIGALIVGGIVNDKENTRFSKAEEKGRFELAGSTIVLLLEKGRIDLLPAVAQGLAQESEVRVLQGQWVATAERN